MALRVVPATLIQANAYVAEHHRHHKPSRGHRFSLLCVDETDTIHGVCIVGRPVSASLPAYRVAEVTRLCTDGTRNACSILYAAAARACLAMGFEYIQTYTLPEEGGASLRASGWRLDGQSSGRTWNSPKRSRNADQDGVVKSRWVKLLNPPKIFDLFA